MNTHPPDGSTGKSTRPGWYKAKTSRKNATKGQKRALRELYPKWGGSLAYRQVVGEEWLHGLFGNDRPVTLDVGFGCGDAMVQMAKANPERNYLGLDWHTPGVGKALLAIEKEGVTNVRVMAIDAVTFMRHNLQGKHRLFGGVNIFFPDPWDRDLQFRLIREETVALLAAATVPGAQLHVATDVADYVAPATELLLRAGWTPEEGSQNGLIPRPDWRPRTPYEEKGAREGRPSEDLIFRSPETLQEWVVEEVTRPLGPSQPPPGGIEGGVDADALPDDASSSTDDADGCELFDTAGDAA